MERAQLREGRANASHRPMNWLRLIFKASTSRKLRSDCMAKHLTQKPKQHKKRHVKFHVALFDVRQHFFILKLSNRQHDAKCRALPDLAFYFNVAVMVFDDMLDNSEAKPGSALGT